jgi:hypothetical protein
VLLWNAFTSCSAESRTSFSGNVQCAIKTNFGRDIHKLSVFENEKEVLFPPMTFFKVVKAEQEDNILYVEMEEMMNPLESKTLIWVDDNPIHDAGIRQRCDDIGVNLVSARSTAEAESVIEEMGIFDTESSFQTLRNLRFVTDMARVENGVLNETAGLDFLQLLRTKYQYKDVVTVYTSASRLEDTKVKAKVWGPVMVISNGIAEFVTFAPMEVFLGK